MAELIGGVIALILVSICFGANFYLLIYRQPNRRTRAGADGFFGHPVVASQCRWSCLRSDAARGRRSKTPLPTHHHLSHLIRTGVSHV